MDDPKTLETLVAGVIRSVKSLFLDFVGGPEEGASYDLWAAEMDAMIRATTQTNYICEEILVIFMNWRITVSERWESVRQDFRDYQREHYNTLQVKLDSIIARMQFKILLLKLADLAK